MTGRRAALLLAGVAALGASVAAWVPLASAAFLWITGLGAHPFFAAAPLWTKATAWTLYAPQAAANWWAAATVALSAAAASLPLAACLAVAGRRAVRPLHGEARFATAAEVRRAGVAITAGPRPDAVLLGRWGWGPWRRYLSDPSDGHVALYARTGAGKGVSFVVPTCLTWGGSLVAYDIKGELWRLTAGAREAAGQDVFRFAPTDEDGRTHRYNPYSVVPRGEPGCIDAVHKINHVLIPPNPKVENPFWDNAARAAINGLAVMLAETPGAALNPSALRHLALRHDYREAILAMIERARAENRPFPQTAVDDVMTWIGGDDTRTRDGVKATIQSHLALWGSPAIAAATAASDFDLRGLRRRPASIYVCLSPADTRRLRPLVALLFQQIVTLNTKVGEEFGQDPEHRCRVLMMLDEFAAMGPMPVLADAAAYVRSFGLRMAYVVQTKPQLVSIYGKEGADNLFENTGPEVWFGVKSRGVAEDASADLGHDTVTETSRSRPRFLGLFALEKHTENTTVRRRPLMFPQEVRRLPRWREVVTVPHGFPIRARRILWFKDPCFRGLATAAPEVPRQPHRVERDATPAAARNGRDAAAADAEPS